MDAGETIRRDRREYGNILLGIRRAESLARVMKRGGPKARIQKIEDNYKRAIEPITVRAVIGMGKRI